MQEKQQKREKISWPERITVLELMGILAVVGLVVNGVLRHFFHG